MAGELDGARLKIERARKHFHEFDTEIGPYIMSDGERLIPHGYHNDGVDRRKPIDARFACMIGDCLFNLRSSLDYVTWQLAVKFYGQPLAPTEHGAVQFPVHFSAESFHKPKGRAQQFFAKYRIPPAVQAEIERVQPYPARDQELGIIHRLHNHDKHCLLLAAVSHAKQTSGTFSEKVVLDTTPDDDRGDRERPAEITGQGDARPPVGTVKISTHVHVEQQIAIHVTLTNVSPPIVEPIYELVPLLISAVGRVVNAFEQFF